MSWLLWPWPFSVVFVASARPRPRPCRVSITVSPPAALRRHSPLFSRSWLKASRKTSRLGAWLSAILLVPNNWSSTSVFRACLTPTQHNNMNARRLWMSSLRSMVARSGLGVQGSQEGSVRSRAHGPARLARVRGAGAIGALLLATVLRTEGAEPAHARAAVASNIVLTVAQRQKLHTVTMQPSAFRRTIETTGTVGFDNDQATTVLSPVIVET